MPSNTSSLPSRLAQLIAHQEGFGVPGAVPTTHNNPGDLRHSPHSSHPKGPNDIGVIDTVEHGWEDLERQLQLYAIRWVRVDPRTQKPCPSHLMNLVDLAYTYAPPGDNNPTESYLASLCKGLGMPDTTPVSEAILIPGL